jgi:cell division protein FtsB
MCIVRHSAIQYVGHYWPLYRVDVNGAWKLITRFVLDADFKPSPESHFHIVIFPNKGGDPAGVAYVEPDPMPSKDKVFHIYPGNQALPLYIERESGHEVSYSCVYYGTTSDKPIEALKKGNEKATYEIAISLAQLQVEVEALKGHKGKTELQPQAKALETQVKTLEAQVKALEAQINTLGKNKADKTELPALIEALKKELNLKVTWGDC